MYKYLLPLLLLLAGCEEVNLFIAADAGTDAIRVIYLSEEDVDELSRQAIQHYDQQYNISAQHTQLIRMLVDRDNIKVYDSDTVNAFAMGDGSIRIYRGLMDLMTDDEIRFVVGHEIGHVEKGHVLEKMRVAYATSAARKGLASLNNDVGQVARSIVGDFAVRLVNAQFSQQEEREADDYGLWYMQEHGYNASSAVTALEKIGGSDYTFLSSHPAPMERAERLRGKLYNPSSTLPDNGTLP
ncbi:MAG: M48 family metalloprotease [Nanobdellota archaeon]